MDKLPRTRIAFLIVLLLLICATYVSALYDLQVIKGEQYREESRSSIITETGVAAARGGILDRYGNLLVSSRVSYNVVFEAEALRASDSAGDTVASLIALADQTGVPFGDGMPVSDPPFEYAENMGEPAQADLKKYIQQMGLAQEISAKELVAFIRSEYGLSYSLSDLELRRAAGILYDLELASLSGSDYVFLEDVTVDLIARLKEQSYAGVDIRASSIREYHTQYASHVLGRIGLMSPEEYVKYSAVGYSMDAYVGKDGVEQAFEQYLRGADGEMVTTSTDTGRTTGVLYSTKPNPGGNVVLTLDIGLQAAAEKSLEKTILALRAGGEDESGSDARGGAVMVMNVKDGEVLASASYPSYNPATYSEDFTVLNSDPYDPFLNRATMGAYAPGSTFKMLTAVAALETGVITGKTTIYDKGIYRFFKDYQPRCWIYPGSHGLVNVVKAIEVSCNYFFYDVGRQLGIDELSSYAYSFGLGRSTGIEIGDSPGTLATREEIETRLGAFNPGDTLQAAIGQSDNLFTPIQLASYISTLVNGGVRYQAHLLKEVKSSDYSYTEYTQKSSVLGTVQMQPDNLALVLQGMRQAALSGTPSEVFGDYPIPIGAKTGTAQISSEYSNNGVFVCFAPFDEPEIAVVVVVERGGSGSKIAGIARDVMDYYFNTQAQRDAGQEENRLLM